MALSRVHMNKVQADTCQGGSPEGNNFQTQDAQADNVDCFDIVESNDSDKIDKSNASEDNVGNKNYYADRLRRTLSTFASRSPANDEK
jgi:hypothetical protein